jgi:hypothetical protein
MAANYKGNDTPLSPEHMQCAGAAIFRRNIGVASRMPDPLLKLDTDDSNVFANLEEFIKHHEPDLDQAMVERMVQLANRGYYTQLEVLRSSLKNKLTPVDEIQARYNAQKGGEA